MNVLRNAELSLAVLVTCSAKVTSLFSFASILAKAARRRSASLWHLIWSLGILGSLILPLLTLMLPAWHSVTLWNASQLLSLPHGMAGNPSAVALRPMIVEASAESPLFSKVSSSVLLVWAVGFSFFSIRLVGGIARLVLLSAHSKPLSEEKWTSAVLEISKRFKIARPVHLLQCRNQAVMLLTWGGFRPLIMLPAVPQEWREDRTRIVICHELAHVARGDWLCRLVRSWREACIGSIRSLGKQPPACGKRVNAPVTIRS